MFWFCFSYKLSIPVVIYVITWVNIFDYPIYELQGKPELIPGVQIDIMVEV